MLPSHGVEADKLKATMHIDDLKKQLGAKNEQLSSVSRKTTTQYNDPKRFCKGYQEVERRVLGALPEGTLTDFFKPDISQWSKEREKMAWSKSGP